MLKKFKNKRIILGLALLSVLSIFFLLSSTKKPRPPILTAPLPFTTRPPSSLQITNSYPPSGKYTSLFPSTALTFTFNQPISLDKVRVEITPKTSLSLSLSSNRLRLYASPAKPWQYDKEYKIKVIGVGGVTLIDNTTIFLDPAKHPPTEEAP